MSNPDGQGQVVVNAKALAELIKYANEQAKGWASEFTRIADDEAGEHDPELKAVVARLRVHPAHEEEAAGTTERALKRIEAYVAPDAIPVHAAIADIREALVALRVPLMRLREPIKRSWLPPSAGTIDGSEE